MPIVLQVSDFISATFDYLIVGGGTAGLALAARLTENANITVGVLEAGGYHPDIPEINVPGMMSRLIANPNYDWTFFSIPQQFANNRVVFQPRGKALGGSSMLNFTGMLRPTKEEFDALEALGNPGWNWDSFLKYMKKSERLLPHSLSKEDTERFAAKPNPAFHGTDGPVVKSFPLHVTDVSALFLDSIEKLGVPRNSDSSCGRPVGASLPMVSVDPRTATRSYATSYFIPNASRPNLLILTGAHVVKIIFTEGTNGLKHACGVEFVKDGTKSVVTNIVHDVILSAGTFQTPQLLELSGIGDQAHLGHHGIDCVIDLPGVGENLQDHITVPTIVELDNTKYESADFAQQKGFLSSVADPFFAFIPALALGGPDDVHKWIKYIETYTVKNMAAKTESSVKSGLEMQYNLLKQWFSDRTQPVAQFMNTCGHVPIPGLSPVPGKVYSTLFSVFTHPFSRGSVHISSADPLEPPEINPNYFANPGDLDLMAQIVDFSLQLMSTNPLADAVVTLVTPVIKDGEDRRNAIINHVKNTCNSSYHPVGTAAMLPRESGGVVDSNLLVYGTDNLRVVDLSILPLELSCNTQSTAYAVGEKAADIIKGLL